MLCVCGCSSDNYCLLRGWISTCSGLCVLYGSPTRLQLNWYSIKQLSPRLSHLSQLTELVTLLLPEQEDDDEAGCTEGAVDVV